MNKYFLPDNYEPNVVNHTIETEHNNYWNEKRLKKAELYQWSTYNTAKKIFLRKKYSSVIDIGCGPAIKLMKNFSKISNNIMGIDQESAINYCQKRYHKGKFIIDNIENSNKKIKSKMDLIICCDVIEHLHDPDLLLKYIKMYAHKESTIVISTPERISLLGQSATKPSQKEHIREWSQKEFSNYLKNNGFNIIQHQKLPSLKLSIISIEAIEFFSKLIRKKLFTNQVVICNLK